MKSAEDKLAEAVELWREYGECDAFVEAWEAYVNTLTPPKPPIDTSLAASIERVILDMQEVVAHDPYAMSEVGAGVYEADIHRIIEAARKWDEVSRLTELREKLAMIKDSLQ